MKICSRCKINKNISNFYKNGNGYYSICKTCASCSRPERKQKRIKKLQRYVELLKNKPCMDCGDFLNPWQMDFDHRDASIKINSISTLCSQKAASLSSIIEEIAKCDLVCANCHRERTHIRLIEKKLGI